MFLNFPFGIIPESSEKTTAYPANFTSGKPCKIKQTNTEVKVFIKFKLDSQNECYFRSLKKLTVQN